MRKLLICWKTILVSQPFCLRILLNEWVIIDKKYLELDRCNIENIHSWNIEKIESLKGYFEDVLFIEKLKCYV